MNERITEDLIESLLKKKDYFSNDFIVEKQTSKNKKVNELLKTASKKGTQKKGFPEFIIQSEKYPGYLIVFEAKADIKKHQSDELNKPVEYAVDGAIHYGKNLSKKFNVIAVAVSGQKKSNLEVSNFFFKKGSKEYNEIIKKDKKPLQEILSWEDYIEHVTFDHSVVEQTFDDLLFFARKLHNFFREEAKLSDEQKPLVVCGTLIALQDIPFQKTFEDFNKSTLSTEWYSAIERQINIAAMPQVKKDEILMPYQALKNHSQINKSNKKYSQGILYEIISIINENVLPYITVFKRYDIIGRFFNEFLKYSGGDKQSFGIVLTPHHITDLFCDLAYISPDSRILDTCCGTGGFLVSAMYRMIEKATTESQQNKIISTQLVGAEEMPEMFALAAGNMILRGDGKSQLFKGDSFDSDIISALKKAKCDIGMINPPFSQKSEDNHELTYVLNMLNMIKKGGKCIAIVPMSCVISPSEQKKEIMRNHTVEATMSMPNDLFYPVGTVTCIIVIKAKVPHEDSDIDTWMGYWKDDGFIKDKIAGRADINKSWDDIKAKWIKAYKNKDIVKASPLMPYKYETVKKKLSHDDEWCVEAYMETNYENLDEKTFNKHLKDLIVYKVNDDS